MYQDRPHSSPRRSSAFTKTAGQALCVLVALCASASSGAEPLGLLKSEHFDTDPGWEGFNNRPVPKALKTVCQDFGYSPTQFAGRGKGEIGGTLWRGPVVASYAMPIAPKTLRDPLANGGRGQAIRCTRTEAAKPALRAIGADCGRADGRVGDVNARRRVLQYARRRRTEVMNRRMFLGALAAGGMTGLVPRGSPAAAADAEVSFDAVPRDRWTGEPYELAGHRMVFTTWYYVRPGGYAWVDAQGRGVSASGAKLGPWDAHFRRSDDTPRGIRLVVETPNRLGPITLAERPWEAMGLSLAVILHDGGRFRAWGSCQDAEGRRWACYLESDDGKTWKRPELGLVPYAGNTRNNLLPLAPSSVFIDPQAPAADRYKGCSDAQISMAEFRRFIAKHPGRWEHRALRRDAGWVSALVGYVSPDGLKWTRLEEPFTVEHTDTQVVGGYCAARGKYMIFTRNYFVGPRSPRAPEDPLNMSWLGEARGSGRRSIGYTESDRFGDFPVSQVILVPRPEWGPSALLYTNGYTTVPGAPDQHLLFPTVWDTTVDATRLAAAASHDGRVWQWIGQGLMETGPFGQFDGGSIFWHPNLLELPSGDFVLPYTGYAFPHKYPRGAWSYRPGYAVWPKGRLAGIAAEETGEFSTVSFFPPGQKLRINCVTRRAGSVLVAVTRRDGQFLPGRSFDDAVPIVGDQFRTPVRWKSGDDLGPAGQPVCLRFRLDRATLYALDFASG